MALATIAGTQLTAALKPQLTLLVDDMRARLNADTHELENWRTTHREAVREQRTATSWTDWSEDQLTQAAVGWLLTSVFVRFCEDNLLLGDTAVWIVGPTPLLRQRAVDAENSFYREHQDCSYREWLEQSFEALRRNPATQALVDEHAALNIISPSSDAVQQLINFWRQTDDTGELVWNFHDDTLSTRFLGDLYQNLSDSARENLSLLQTPEFVEEFILDRTLEPALKDRPLEGFKLIDPTCGSGHFLLGAFTRLLNQWHRHAPALELRTKVDNSLRSIYGVDLNPFAIAIAKFRLIVAAMRFCGEKSLLDLPKFSINLAVGDSLLHGPERGGRIALNYDDQKFDKDSASSGHTYSTEDAAILKLFLSPSQYDVVVGNPPYHRQEDSALNDRYREIYESCSGKFTLPVPFMERFFQLAKSDQIPGWVGQITANTFMKRQFGKKLVNNHLKTLDLRLIADMSGVYMEGFGLPTVIIVGRNHTRIHSNIRVVLGIKGEPGRPEVLHDGKVWSSIRDHIDDDHYQDQWISVSEMRRDHFDSHPWSLSGGGAIETAAAIEAGSKNKLADIIDDIGMTFLTGEDESYILPVNSPLTRRVAADTITVIEGDAVRDWHVNPGSPAITTFKWDGSPRELSVDTQRHLWRNQTRLRNRIYFSKTPEQRGLRWFDIAMYFPQRHVTPNSICFAETCDRNKFYIHRGGAAFKQTAPAIKFAANASERDQVGALGVLNSSLACFWLKEQSHNYGDRKDKYGSRITGSPEFDTYNFTTTIVQRFPMPAQLPDVLAQKLDALGKRLEEFHPNLLKKEILAEENRLRSLEETYNELRGTLIALQEELDWDVYRRYDLIDEDLTVPGFDVPIISLGQRAFEIALSRRIDIGNEESDWFTRHSSKRVSEIPLDWPEKYRTLISKRLEAIEKNPFVGLLENARYKRRWTDAGFREKVKLACRTQILEMVESPHLWFNHRGVPTPRSISELAGELEKDPDFVTVLNRWAGHKDANATVGLTEILSSEHVPYLTRYYLKESGLRKYSQWMECWEAQRSADEDGIAGTKLPGPPLFKDSDFTQPDYWKHRGKINTARERFISFPGLGRETDPTPLLGWAGWNHAQQGLALGVIYAMRESEGKPLSALVPVVAGMAEVLPWVKQWHSGVDTNLGIDLFEYLAAQLAEKSAAVGVPVQDLPAWRPEKKARGRKAATGKAGK